MVVTEDTGVGSETWGRNVQSGKTRRNMHSSNTMLKRVANQDFRRARIPG